MSKDNSAETKKKRRRRWGDRAEGRRLRTLSPMSRVAVYIMPNRTGALNYIRDTIDVSEIEKYIKQKKAEGLRNFNFMHIIVGAYVRCVSQMPALNRFIAGREVFARNNIEVALTIKKEMTLESPDTVIKIDVPADATSDDVYRILSDEIENYRNDPGGSFDKTAKILSKMPGLVMAFAMRLIRFADYFGWLPRKLTKLSPFHASMFITSMGSLGIPTIFHHLYDLGNCPVFISFGAKERKLQVNAEGQIEKKETIDFTVTMDERICDGYYFARALKKMRFILRDPWQLESPPEEVFEDID
ncbi:MAG: 2-oxo acid dehydrogenase subunit E2 [Clostridia bacterium]|nr:2-oxo acid dehydrogenase subunit E2 [Clostridia bacterium]